MQKKFFISGLSLILIVGLTFFVAKIAPCNAQMVKCSRSKPVVASNLVDKRVPIGDYTEESVSRSLAEHKRVVLFFQASWCSTCYLIEQNLQNNASQIPNDVVISRVNIDKNKELKARYSVVAQDEMVQIGQNWTEKSHWKSSERAVEELLVNLK